MGLGKEPDRCVPISQFHASIVKQLVHVIVANLSDSNGLADSQHDGQGESIVVEPHVDIDLDNNIDDGKRRIHCITFGGWPPFIANMARSRNTESARELDDPGR